MDLHGMIGPAAGRQPVAFVFTLLLIAFTLPTVVAAQGDGEASTCSGQVGGFALSGNETSRDELLIKLSGLLPGQRYNAETLKVARQRLLDSGLFKEVVVEARPACSVQSDIAIEVEEKYYHLVYPRLNRNGDGDVSTGLRYRGSNLFGRDHSMVVGVSRKQYASGEETDSRLFSYRLPLVSRPYEFRWAVSDDQTLLSETLSPVHEFDRFFEFAVGRDWLNHPFERPILVLAQIGLREKELQGRSPEVEIIPGRHNSVGLRLEYDDVHEAPYRRYGKFVALDISKGVPLLQSDFNPWIIRAEWRNYRRLNGRDNLNTRLLLALADESVFNEPLYSIGGSDTLRGLATEYRLGNQLWQANVEYIIGLTSTPSLRFALFSDIGNVFARHDELDRHGWKLTLGAGLRWKIRSFVKTDLVIDYGYNPGTGYSKIYAGTSLPF